MTGPRISVIIPTFGRREALGHCLMALTRQTLAPDQFEVIVVDDGGPPGIEEAIRPVSKLLDCRLLQQTNQGPGAARNHGARVARGQILAFTDDDCKPEPGWLAALATGFEARPDDVLGGPVVNSLARDPYAATSQLIVELAYDFQNPDPQAAEFFASNNLATSAAAFARIGGFDPSFRIASEDRAFCARARELGVTISLVPDAVVGHLHHSSFTEFWRQHFRYGRGAWQYHASLRSRRRGRLHTDVRFHGRFLGMAASRLSKLPIAAAVWVTILLGVWQVANAAGFGYQGLASSLGPRIRRRPPPIGPGSG